jgi:aspartate 1-decarboxylase
MLLNMCIAKIHRATVTDADLNYVGSISIDKSLMQAVGILNAQMVQITNLMNGMLWRTYALEAPAGSGNICLNGPPARHFQKNDKVIILAEALMTREEAMKTSTLVVFVDDQNAITRLSKLGPQT